MPLWLLARIQLEFEPLGSGSLLGSIVPLLFLLALVGIVFGHQLKQEAPSQRKQLPSLSNLLPEAAPAAVPFSGTASPAGNSSGNAKRPGLTGRERRVAVRRGGNPLPVLLADPADTAAALEGTVLDRSRGGLLIASTERRGAGTILRVRPKDAPEDVDWMLIQVRHAQQKNDRWLLGCAFTRKMDWSELLLFG